MLEVNLRGDHEALLEMGSDDAKTAEAVMLELIAYISLVCGATSRWKLYQSQPASNSFSLHGPGPGAVPLPCEHDRAGRHQGHDRPSPGKLVTTLETRGEAREFVKSLVS